MGYKVLEHGALVAYTRRNLRVGGLKPEFLSSWTGAAWFCLMSRRLQRS